MTARDCTSVPKQNISRMAVNTAPSRCKVWPLSNNEEDTRLKRTDTSGMLLSSPMVLTLHCQMHCQMQDRHSSNIGRWQGLGGVPILSPSSRCSVPEVLVQTSPAHELRVGGLLTADQGFHPVPHSHIAAWRLRDLYICICICRHRCFEHLGSTLC